MVGRTLLLNRAAYTVVGVMPPRFHFPDDVDVWQRLEWDMTQHSRAAHFMEGVARLADGATPAGAQAAVDALAGRWQDEFARTNRGWGTRVLPLLHDDAGRRAETRPPGAGVVFGFAARFERGKGPLTLLEAFAAARRGVPGIRLRMSGVGPLAGAARERAVSPTGIS